MTGQLTYIKGDLFTTKANIIAHSVNCLGGFGSGVAGQISRIYPTVRTAYIQKFRTSGWRLGEVQFVEINKNRIIANLATQYTFGGPGVHVDYDALRTCFYLLIKYAQENKMDIAIPKLSAGLAGGSWSCIEKIIIDVLVGHPVNVTCYTLD